jgi:monofunctional biosynthetic peptidoglycan transglycosylase
MCRINFPLTASVLALWTPIVSANQFEFDFAEGPSSWTVVVDGVMGGRSTGKVSRNELGGIRFSGTLSLENNGGFSQMRSDVTGDEFEGASGLEVTFRGDGRSYNFDGRCSDARVMAGGFQRTFETEAGVWKTIQLPFDEFRLYSFGRRVRGAKAITPTMIESIGVTLSDKAEGPFSLDVASIRTASETPTSSRWTKPDLATLGSRSTLDRLRTLIETDDRERGDAAASASASAEAVRLTELAISRGVPMFNAGQPAASAAIYEVAIEAMLALGADDLGRSVVERLEEGLDQARAERNWSDRAWTYRRALDDAYPELARQARPSGVASR